MSEYKLLHGDCMKLMWGIEDRSVDLVLADLPYGATANKWDIKLPLTDLFSEYERVLKDHGAVVLFGLGRFGAELIMHAPKKMPYRYQWIWRKTMPVGFLQSHHAPLRVHESLYVFYKHLPTYNPQMRYGFKPYKRNIEEGNLKNYGHRNACACESHGERYPIDVLDFSNLRHNNVHPTQKPVDLLEYMIKTYTNEGDLVLDNTMGSGSTGVAAVKNNRRFIGMEMNEEYFKIAKERIESIASQETLDV
jgi:DNA modification methylase